jgi:site-specific DNA-methyltransferase (cytosine-N4-specific)
MLTEAGDLVVDPFCGSCATGEAAERTRREWICCDLVEDYLKGALGRFQRSNVEKYSAAKPEKSNGEDSYRAVKPGLLWNGVEDDEPLAEDGGAKRVVRNKKPKPLPAKVHPHEPKAAQMALLESYSPAQKRRKHKGK